MSSLIKFLLNPGYRFVVLGNLGFFKSMPDDVYLKKRFEQVTGMPLNLDEPKTFNEKLQWLKIHDRNPLYTQLVDKAEVKRWVEEKIGSKYVIPTYGVYERFADIDFEALPNQFVIKCTHDSGSSFICKSKEDINFKALKMNINRCLRHNLFWPSREWAYKNVKPRIIVEKYINSTESEDITDYKFLCFNGSVKCSFTCTGRHSDEGLRVTFFDRDWNVMPFERHYQKSSTLIPKPTKYEEMIELAEKLTEDIPFARIDFYEDAGKIFFGEVTLYPGAGTEEFRPVEWDYKLGDMLILPSDRK